MKIYFAGSIRGGREDWENYAAIIQQLRLFGDVLTEHVGDGTLFNDGEAHTDREIHDRDLQWLNEADCIVAEVTTPSLGVGYEIACASGWRKPILCLYRLNSHRRLSAMIAGCPQAIVKSYRDMLQLNAILTEFFEKSLSEIEQ